MHTHHKKSQKLAIGLSTLAGFVDALGFLSLGGVFASFMSGNSTRLGVGIIESARLDVALLPLGVIVLFVIGVMAGKLIRCLFPLHGSISVLVFMSLALFCAALLQSLSLKGLCFPFMVIAMGAANNVFIKEGEVSIGVTYMTGSLVKLGQRLAGVFLKEPDSIWLPYLYLWLGLTAGALLGTFCFIHLGLSSLWISCLFCAILTAYSAKLNTALS